MNPLVTYYLFLIAAAVSTIALHKSEFMSGNRNRYLGNLVVAPLILIEVTTQSMSRWAGLLIVMLIVALGSWLVRGSNKPVTSATARWSIIFWLIEAIVPVSFHFALRLPDNAERTMLLATGSALFLLFIVTFYAFAPDLRKPANTRSI